MAGTLLAARFVAMWGLGFATGLFAAQLSMAGTGRPEGSGAPVQAQPSATTAQAAVEAGEPARAPSSSRRGQQPTGAMRFDARYDFDVSIDGTDRATVLERLTATNTTARSINHLDLFVLPNFDAPGFREFELGSVRVDGRVVETLWTRDGANLEVVLPHPLEPGQTARVMILFWLRPATAADGDGDLAAALSRRGALMQFHLWYPMLSDGHGVALDSDGASATPASPIEYVIRTEAHATFAVPGTVTNRTEREVRGTLEHARDFAFAVGRGIRTWSGRAASGVVVSVYGPAKAAGGTTLALAIGAVDRLEALLRMPYPAADLVVVAGSTNMESSGIVFVDRDHLEDPYTVAHEVAHEWFHWLVGNDQLREPWLDEAFATYLGGGLVPRHEEGYCSYRPVNEPVWRFPDADPRMTWQHCDDYMETVYYKGSWLVHTVRVAMGDAAFLASLQDYLRTYRFGVATTADIVAIWRAHSDAVTSELLLDWLELRTGTAGPRHPA